MPHRIIFLTLLISCLFPIAADELHLKDGVIVEGLVTENDDGYAVTIGSGAVTMIKKENVVKHIKKLTNEQKYENLKLVCRSDDFDAQMNLGLWCRLHNLPDQAREHFENAVKLNPADPKARRSAGYSYHNNKWYKPDEWMKLQGKVKYNGKWLDKKEAQALEAKDRKDKTYAEGYRETWKLLMKIGKAESTSDVSLIVNEIRKLGESSYGALIRGATDSNQRIRQASIEILTTINNEDALSTILKSFRYERTKKIVIIIIKSFGSHPQKEKITHEVLRQCMTSKSIKTRKRCWLAFRSISDKTIIEKLIANAEYCPVPPDMRITDDKKVESTGGGMVTHDGEKSQRQKPYYPATEALNYLTEAGIPPDKKLWEKWWESNKSSFTIKPAFKTDEKDIE